MKNNNKIFIGIILLISLLTVSAVSAETLTVKPTSEDNNIHWEFTGIEV